MSSLLEEVATIGNPPELVQWLCPHLFSSRAHGTGSSSTQLADIDWSREWEAWEDDRGGGTLAATEEEATLKRSSPPSPQPEASWLTECITAVSPTCDLMAIGFKNRLVILSRRWENRTEEKEGMKLVVNWRGTVGYAADDEISSLLCLPLISQKQSSTGEPDWTCIIVGFTSGYVAMYTENGLILLSQQFEEGRVLSLFCRTHPAVGPLLMAQDMTEELVMLYPRAITTIDGFSLFQTLRGCRNQVAKAAASGGDTVNVPPLGYKKWGLVDQEFVTDCIAPGLCPPIAYDHMAQSSLAKGFNHAVSPGVPATSLHITTGRAPFAGFLIAQEGSAPPFVADVARLYASKLKDALVSAASGWLFGKSKNKDAEQPKMKTKIETATPLPYRFSIPDKPRVGQSISMGSGRRWAAITDELGRVTLVDVQRGVTLRMWKGYRDAECGWVEVEGEWGGGKRWVSFLLIYAPRRGLLEVWVPQQGPRVAVFNVPKQSKLIYTPHTLLGANSVRGVRCKVFPVIFISPDGSMCEVTIPFHLALGGKTSKRARDLHLVKTLKSHLKNGSESEVLTVMSEIKTMAVRRQAVTTLILSQHLTVSLLQGLLDIFVPIYCAEDSEAKDNIQTLDHEGRLFGQQLVRLEQLQHFYTVLQQLHGAREASPDPEDHQLLQELAKILVLTPKETKDLLMTCGCSEHSKTGNTKKVKFRENEISLSIGSFIRCWDLSVGALAKQTDNSALPVDLRQDLQLEKKLRLGELLYGWSWHRESIRLFSATVRTSGANPESLLHVALEYWAQGHTLDTVATLHFGMVVHTLASLAENRIICDISEQSKWWTAVRDKLVASLQPHHAYMAALLFRGVHATLETKAHRGSAGQETESMETSEQGNEECKSQDTVRFPSLNDWEGLSMEMVEWNLILWQLGCLMPLSTLSSLLPHNGPKRLPNLEVSIKSLLDKGKGYVAELVANWFLGSGLPLDVTVKLLTQHDKVRERKRLQEFEEEAPEETLAMPSDTELMEVETNKENSSHEEIFNILEKVGDKFPHSVAGDSVLTNMAWELAAAWHKNPDDVIQLSQATEHIAKIKNSHIRHGVSLMIWETWVSKCVQAALGLMEKVGRLPKDRLCRRDLSLGEHSLASVFRAAVALLEQLLEANVVCEVEKPLVLTADRFWSGQDGSPALVEVTIMQKMTCYDLVYHHHQLLCVLYFIAHHNLKNMKPLSCFDGKGRSVFFKPLSTIWTLELQSDPAVSKARTSLMCKVISSAVNAQPDTTSPSQGVAPSVRQALDLARAWEMPVDPLHRQYICELYNSGFDKHAEEILGMVHDKAMMGSQLVLLAGQRLHHHLATTPHTAHHLALTAPSITEWVKSCEFGSLRCPSVPLQQTLELLGHTLHLLPETSQEYKMATALHQTMAAFVEDQKAVAAAT